MIAQTNCKQTLLVLDYVDKLYVHNSQGDIQMKVKTLVAMTVLSVLTASIAYADDLSSNDNMGASQPSMQGGLADNNTSNNMNDSSNMNTSSNMSGNSTTMSGNTTMSGSGNMGSGDNMTNGLSGTSSMSGAGSINNNGSTPDEGGADTATGDDY